MSEENEEKGAFGCSGHWGVQGGGKSRDIVENDIIPALIKGRHVYTNIPLLIDGLIAYYRVNPELVHILDEDGLKNLYLERAAREKSDSGILAHALVVHDEIQDMFAGGVYNRDPVRNAFIQVLAWGRHDDMEFIWGSQHYSSVDADLRRRTHIYVHNKSLFHFGLKSKWKKETYLPDKNTGEPIGEACSSEVVGVNQKVFRCYKSSEVGNHAQSTRLRGYLPKSIVLLSLVCLVILAYVAYRVVKNGNPLAPATTTGTDRLTASIVPSADTTKQPMQQMRLINETGIDGYICMHGICHAYRGGVEIGTYIDSIVYGPTIEQPKLRENLFPRSETRSQNGNNADMSGGAIR